METDRLLLRERNRKLIERILELPVEKQAAYFGYATSEAFASDHNKMKTRYASDDKTAIKWDLLLKDNNVVVGNVILHNWHPEHARAEIGYYLHDPYRGMGYVVEALKTIFRHGFGEMNLNRIEAFISPENSASIKVVETLGFTLEGKLRQHYHALGKTHDSLVYGLLREEFIAEN